jgi:hypothetical protein
VENHRQEARSAKPHEREVADCRRFFVLLGSAVSAYSGRVTRYSEKALMALSSDFIADGKSPRIRPPWHNSDPGRIRCSH